MPLYHYSCYPTTIWLLQTFKQKYFLQEFILQPASCSEAQVSTICYMRSQRRDSMMNSKGSLHVIHCVTSWIAVFINQDSAIWTLDWHVVSGSKYWSGLSTNCKKQRRDRQGNRHCLCETHIATNNSCACPFIRGPFGIRSGFVWDPFRVRSGSVAAPLGVVFLA